MSCGSSATGLSFNFKQFAIFDVWISCSLLQDISALTSQLTTSESAVSTLTELIKIREGELAHSKQAEETLKEDLKTTKEKMVKIAQSYKK